MEKSYIELEIAFNKSTYDLIYNRLYLNGLTTILEENGTLKVYLPEADSVLAEKIRAELTSHDNIPASEINIGIFENKDWNTEWEKTIEPVYILDKLVIYPSWKKQELELSKGNIPIEIDPKMSFGTGHNETTQLILEQMSVFIDPAIDKYLLDFGSGTGILSIAAIKLGVENAVAIEIDEDSVQNAAEYFELNGVSGNIVMHQADIADITETGFDVVAANITSNVIIPNLTNIYNKLKPGGKLFVTGILKEETDALINELTKHNFLMQELKQRAEWSAFYAIKQ
ncbi:MAG: 50S ribosomal protein L11 methyltransferase [Ignavibacteria bacterium]|nr:50S ribosomal protein L11 methyltransferase [Ignavibacteria bacterium]